MARLSVLVPEMLGSSAEPMDALGFTTLQRSTQPRIGAEPEPAVDQRTARGVWC